jgi:plastocyanin
MSLSFRQRVAALGLLLCSVVPGAALAPRATTHTITIDGTQYQPATLTIALGDTVVWVNKDPFPHTATSKDGTFDSKAIAAGKSWKFKPAKRGDFTYSCTYHVTMHGELHVK